MIMVVQETGSYGDQRVWSQDSKTAGVAADITNTHGLSHTGTEIEERQEYHSVYQV